jgi:glycosyltransferase involved in cell wall biosynthesis
VNFTNSISIIIPAYNRAGLIGETLRSLLNQTVPAKEIIVVDDGSTDGTAEAVEREFSVFREQFSASHKPSSVFSVPSVVNPSLRVIRQQNAGPGAARNRGLAEATGEFIHFFDSDDIASPNKHEVQLHALLETGADIAYGPWVKGRFAPVEKLKDFFVI